MILVVSLSLVIIVYVDLALSFNKVCLWNFWILLDYGYATCQNGKQHANVLFLLFSSFFLRSSFFFFMCLCRSVWYIPEFLCSALRSCTVTWLCIILVPRLFLFVFSLVCPVDCFYFRNRYAIWRRPLFLQYTSSVMMWLLSVTLHLLFYLLHQVPTVWWWFLKYTIIWPLIVMYENDFM